MQRIIRADAIVEADLTGCLMLQGRKPSKIVNELTQLYTVSRFSIMQPQQQQGYEAAAAAVFILLVTKSACKASCNHEFSSLSFVAYGGRTSNHPTCVIF